MAKSDRSKKFEASLKDIVENKPDLLVELEKSVRLLVHVYDLIGEADEKLMSRLREAGKSLQEAYENTTE